MSWKSVHDSILSTVCFTSKKWRSWFCVKRQARARAYETGELPPPLPKEERQILAERSFEGKIKSDICPMCEKLIEEREYIGDEVWMEPCGHHYTGDAHTVKWDPVQRTIAWDCYHPE